MTSQQSVGNRLVAVFHVRNCVHLVDRHNVAVPTRRDATGVWLISIPSDRHTFVFKHGTLL